LHWLPLRKTKRKEMATKKPTITLGKGTPATPASRPVSAKPSQASQVRATQRTTSSGITTRPDGRRQSEGRSGRQSVSKAKITSEAQTRPSGSRGVYEKPNPKVTIGMGSRLAATNTAMKGAASAALYTAANAALGPLARKAGTKLGNALKPVGRAIDDRLPGINSKDELKRKTAAANAAIKTKGKTADSFGGQYQKPAAGAKPKPAPKMSKAKSFDNAFASARNSGMSSFVWGGKRYTTKLK
jgi:hypothetical protein